MTPLCVDLDGTLIDGDTLIISALALARRSPWALPPVGLALIRGRAAFKTAIARRFVPDPATFPWRRDVVDFVRQERERGRRVYLATAAHRAIAEAVAAHLGCFDGIVCTEDNANAKGEAKLRAIRQTLGDTPFDYVGDHAADLPIFQAAERAYLVAPSSALLRAARACARVERVLVERKWEIGRRHGGAKRGACKGTRE